MDITKLEPIEDYDDGLLKLDLSSKKKKRKNKNRQIDDNDSNTTENALSGVNHGEDYTYDFLLSRVFTKLLANNPELTQRPSKIHLQPPDVQREGTKKTVMTNFAKLCKQLNRDKEHVMSYILSELCANGSIDGTERLIIRGKFSPSAIERIARNYISEYVICHGCKSIDTFIERDKSSRLMFLKCNLCQSSVTIKPIVNGYRAKI
jgi:translation initiation factor 2 subunit 2